MNDSIIAGRTPSHPDAAQRWCDICAGIVWIAPSSLEMMVRQPGMQIVCIECAPGAFATFGGQLVVSEATRAELRARGFTDIEIDVLVAEMTADIERQAGG